MARTQLEAMEEWEMLKAEYYDSAFTPNYNNEIEYLIASVFSELEHLSDLRGKEAADAFGYPDDLR